MDHRLHLTQPAERGEAHDWLTSAAHEANPAPDVPAAPSIREVAARQPLLQILPPPTAFSEAVRYSLPTLASGVKRSVAEAGFEADAVPNGKRVKLGDRTYPDTERFQESRIVTGVLEGSCLASYAAKKGDLRLLQFMLGKPDFDVNGFDLHSNSYLASAAENGHLTNVQALLGAPGINVNVGMDIGRTALLSAAKNGHFQIVQALLAAPGIDVNAMAYVEGTALISAAAKGYFQIVEALLAAPGIDVNAGAGRGRTALLAATRANHDRIAIVLAAMPAIDVNVRVGMSDRAYPDEYHRYTALMVAAEKGSLSLVRTLLAMKTIEVNLADERGYTPLMLAAYLGHFKIVQALLAMPGVDVHRSTNYAPYLGNSHEYAFGHSCAVRPHDITFSTLSLAERSNEQQVIDALLAIPAPPGSVHCSLQRYLRRSPRLARAMSEKKHTATPAEIYRILRLILYPGSGTASPVPALPPQPAQLDAQRASWLKQKCLDISLGTCPASDVPFLLQSTIPFPAWCQPLLANAIALGFTVGHYRNAPAPL